MDLSGSEHAWWTGARPQGFAGARVSSPPVGPPPGPPPGIPERRASAPPPTPPSTPAPPSGPAGTAPGRDPWQRSTSPQVTSAYRTLGIDWEASWEEVATQFRALAERWHPDRLAGADPAVQAEGQRRMSEFNRAYGELRRILRPSRRDLFST